MQIEPQIALHIGTLIFAAGLAWGVSKRAVVEHNKDAQEKRIEFERRIADVAMCAKRSEDRYEDLRLQLQKISEKLDRLIEREWDTKNRKQ